MLIRGQPTLFNDLLRLRVGLIVQVLASELARLFNCSGQEASSCLLALPPSELKDRAVLLIFQSCHLARSMLVTYSWSIMSSAKDFASFSPFRSRDRNSTRWEKRNQSKVKLANSSRINSFSIHRKRANVERGVFLKSSEKWRPFE